MNENENAKYTMDEQKPNEECGFIFSEFVKIIDADTNEDIMSSRD